MATARDDRHLVRMAVTGRTTVLSGSWSTATGLDLSASTVRPRFFRAGLVALCHCVGSLCPETNNASDCNGHVERRHWRAEWRNVVFSNESRFNMSYNDGRICVRRYAGERNLKVSILQRHRGPTPSVMVWMQYVISPPTY